MPQPAKHDQLQMHSLGCSCMRRRGDQLRTVPSSIPCCHRWLKWLVFLSQFLIHVSKPGKQRTTKTLHHQLSTATLVLRNLAERSTLLPALAATWATNTSPSAKAKAMTHRPARMLATLRRLMTAATQQLTAATCHAYVFQDPCFKYFFNQFCHTDPPQVFFNAYVLSKDGMPQGLYCSMYNQTWGPSYGTNYGQYRGSDRYTVSESYSYSKNS